jgi:hypothetical protein
MQLVDFLTTGGQAGAKIQVSVRLLFADIEQLVLPAPGSYW